jgi:hypothetical protein
MIVNNNTTSMNAVFVGGKPCSNEKSLRLRRGFPQPLIGRSEIALDAEATDELKLISADVQIGLSTIGELNKRSNEFNGRANSADDGNARARDDEGMMRVDALTHRAHTALHIVTNEGPEHAVFGGGAGIDGRATCGARAGLADVAGAGLTIAVVITGLTANADTGLGAGDGDKTGAVGRAVAHGFDRRGLFRGPFGSLDACRNEDCCARKNGS